MNKSNQDQNPSTRTGNWQWTQEKVKKHTWFGKMRQNRTEHIKRGSRWRMLGHPLRIPEDTPAKLAMKSFFLPGARFGPGRPRTTLPTVLSNDLANHKDHLLGLQIGIVPKELKSTFHLQQLEQLATERKNWIKLVAAMQVPPPPAQSKIPTERPRRDGVNYRR